MCRVGGEAYVLTHYALLSSSSPCTNLQHTQVGSKQKGLECVCLEPSGKQPFAEDKKPGSCQVNDGESRGSLVTALCVYLPNCFETSPGKDVRDKTLIEKQTLLFGIKRQKREAEGTVFRLKSPSFSLVVSLQSPPPPPPSVLPT